MDRTESQGERTDDLSWAKQQYRPENRRCFFCRRVGATGSAILGGSPPGSGGKTGTRIDCCPQGQGCKDGRVFHGPPTFVAHWPDEPCGICNRAGAQNPVKGRRIAGNSSRHGTARGNGSSHHR